MKVYQAISKVQAALSQNGIEKNRKNSQGSGYNFRGIDDVYNAIAPVLARSGLCILPRIISRQCDERVSKSGNTLFYVTVEAEFDFVSSEDGSKHTIKTYGEAMDSGDKATSKAMSAAYKYAAFMAFAIPTEGDNDTEAEDHTVLPTGTEPEPKVVQLPLITDLRLKKAIEKIKLGEFTTDKLRACFALTEDQEAMIVKGLSNA